MTSLNRFAWQKNDFKWNLSNRNFDGVSGRSNNWEIRFFNFKCLFFSSYELTISVRTFYLMPNSAIKNIIKYPLGCFCKVSHGISLRHKFLFIVPTVNFFYFPTDKNKLSVLNRVQMHVFFSVAATAISFKLLL